MRMRRRLPGLRYSLHLLLLLGLLWLIVGATATTTSAADMAITVQGFAFSPATITVPVGTKVTWTNKDPATHTVTSDTGVFDSKNLATGATFSFTFNQAGSFAYHCNIHTRMTATIVVTAAAAPATVAAPSAATAAPATAAAPSATAATPPPSATKAAVPTAANTTSATGTSTTTTAVLPTTGEPQGNQNWGLIIALVAAAIIITGGVTFRLRMGNRPSE
ncbi:MAG: cupredoxin domain-containing protein [Thermomicrobiales bacterium]